MIKELVFMMAMMVAFQALAMECPLGFEYTFDESASDEFEQAELDAGKWDDWVWSFQGRRAGFLFARDNVALKDGKLCLTARLMREDEKTVENLRRGFDTYATAIVRAKQKTFYGYYECRAKMMKAGVCNAFWLYDPLSDQPAKKFQPGDSSEEIDIFEVFGKRGTKKDYDCNRVYFMNVHRLYTPYLEGMCFGGKHILPNRTLELKMDFDFWADYHTYGFLWTEKELVWYVDGKKVFSRENDYFKRPMHLTFDCEIMYNWVGEPDSADLPATYSIEYFRFWKQ